MSKQRVIAVTVIHKTIKNGVRGDKSKGIAPIKPEVQVIKPGTIFLVDSKEFAELMKAGAIRVPEADEKVLVSIDHAAVRAEDDDDAPVAAKPAKPAKAKPAAAKKDDGESLV